MRWSASPHSLRAVGPDDLARVLELAAGNPIHIHIAEQTKEVADCLAWSGRRPVQWLAEHVELGPQWCLIHATTWSLTRSPPSLGPARWSASALTEANLGDGISPAATMRRRGRLGVGSDSNVEITARANWKQWSTASALP